MQEGNELMDTIWVSITIVPGDEPLSGVHRTLDDAKAWAREALDWNKQDPNERYEGDQTTAHDYLMGDGFGSEVYMSAHPLEEL